MISKISNVDLYRVFAGILLVVGLIPFFRIPYFVQAIEDGASYNDFIIVVVTLGAFLSMVYVVLTRQRVPAPFGWILLFQFCVLPFSITDGFDAQAVFSYYVPAAYVTAYCWLIYLFIRKGDPLWISALNKALWVLTLANFIAIIVYPTGMYHFGATNFESSYRNWVFGYDNRHAEFYIYAVMLSMLWCVRRTGKQISFSVVLLYLICLISTILVKAGTSMVVLIVLGVYMAVQGRKENNRFFTIRGYLILYAILLISLIVVVCGYVDPFGLRTFLLEDVFGKDATFSGRSGIWTSALSWIQSSFLFGNGIESSSVLMAKLGHGSGAHNEILGIWYLGGLVHFLFFLGLVLAAAKKLYQARNTPVAKIISIAIFCILLLELMRGCNELLWLSMYVMGYYCLEIDDALTKQQGKKQTKVDRVSLATESDK